MKRLLAALPVVLLLTAGCGDGDDKAPTGISRADYLTQVEPICKEANDKIDALPSPTSPAGFQSLIEQTVAIAEKATADFKAVEPPSADKAAVQAKVVAPLEAQVSEAKAYLVKVKAAVAANDQKTLGALLQAPPISTKADTAWMKTYGFKECEESAETD